MSYAYISHEAGKKIIGDDFDNIIDAAKKYMLLNEIKKSFSITATFDFQKSSGSVNASNVLGIIEGTDKKDEYVFLTAHYDHLGIQDGVIYNGADDDGSGTVAVLQMAEAFVKAAKEGKRPKRNIIFMLVSGEEKGLWGSEYYTDHPIFPLEKTTADLNTDMIGRIDTERKKDDTLNYVYVVGHDKLSTELPVINEGVNNKHTKLVLDYRFDDPKDPNRIYYRSDHYNFARKGVPVLFFYDGMLKADYHQPTDDVDKINWPLYAKRAQMIFHTAWDMANKKEMLKRDLPKVADE
jgi:Zn-dependent M28 family amino/carboxypeptidase